MVEKPLIYKGFCPLMSGALDSLSQIAALVEFISTTGVTAAGACWLLYSGGFHWDCVSLRPANSPFEGFSLSEFNFPIGATGAKRTWVLT